MDDVSRILLSCMLVWSSCGCSSHKQTDLLEARLREQEMALETVSQELELARSELEIARLESQDLRYQLAAQGTPSISPEQADVLYRLTGVQIDAMQSAILPASHASEKILNIMVTPIDQYRQPLKYPADLVLEVLIEEQTVARKELTAAEIATLWTSGWINSGYVIQLPLETAKLQVSKIRLRATLRTLDGRILQDQKLLDGVDVSAIETNTTLYFTRPEEQSIQPRSVPDPRPLAERIDTSDRRTIDEFPVLR